LKKSKEQQENIVLKILEMISNQNISRKLLIQTAKRNITHMVPSTDVVTIGKIGESKILPTWKICTDWTTKTLT
jgi:hypothetical protein